MSTETRNRVAGYLLDRPEQVDLIIDTVKHAITHCEYFTDGLIRAGDDDRAEVWQSDADQYRALLFNLVHAIRGDLDTSSSASRQHYIETGQYLAYTKVGD